MQTADWYFDVISPFTCGVPTFRVGGELFWGDDATGMMLDYLADPHLFETGEFKPERTLVDRERKPAALAQRADPAESGQDR